MKTLDADKVVDAAVKILGRVFEGIRLLKVNVAPGTDPDGNALLCVSRSSSKAP